MPLAQPMIRYFQMSFRLSFMAQALAMAHSLDPLQLILGELKVVSLKALGHTLVGHILHRTVDQIANHGLVVVPIAECLLVNACPAHFGAMLDADVHPSFNRVQLDSLDKLRFGQAENPRIQARVLHVPPPGST